MIPIGLNTTRIAVKAAGGPGPYYARLRGAYTVSRLMGSMTDESLRFLQDCQGPALDNGIQLLPVLLFPEPMTWGATYFAQKYKTLDAFWEFGLRSFTVRAAEMIEVLTPESLFAVELLNEVRIDTGRKLHFVINALYDLKEYFVPLTVSRPFPFGLDANYEQEATKFMDLVTFHTYGPGGLEWYLSPVQNENLRMNSLFNSVMDICRAVQEAAQGKPFLCTEDPILPVRGPVGNFFARLAGKPQDKNFAALYRAIGEEYMRCGAMGPGMPWSNCWKDVPDGYVKEMREN